ncbi:MAG: hypothetical protein ACRDU8_07655 [Egibacteraceae bacterium]
MQTCPMCGAADSTVAEDVSDQVIVFACAACDATWADRRAEDDR